MDKTFIQARLSRAGKRLEFIATDETLDRQGEVIPIDSWDLGNFLKNPVLLINHDYKVQNIVGRAERLRIDDYEGRKALLFEPIFHGLTKLAKEVEALVRGGVLSTVSVGFLRKAPSEDGDKQVNELMEISFVPIPANPSAERIRSLLDPELSEMELAAVKSFVENGTEESEPGPASKDLLVIREVINVLESAAQDLGQLLVDKDISGEDSETEEQQTNDNDDSSGGETPETPEAGKGKSRKGRTGGRNFEVRVLRHLVKQLNGALYKINQRDK